MGDEFELDDENLEDEQDTEDEDADGSDESEDDAESESEDQEAVTGDAKRISDLTSKWQKAEARAKAAEAKLQARSSGADAGGDATAEYIELMRETARETIFGSDPRFAQYGLEVSDVEGDTPAEMRASAARLKSVLDKVASGAKKETLKKHGLSPEQRGGGGSTKQPDYAAMSDEDFEKQIARAKGTL